MIKFRQITYLFVLFSILSGCNKYSYHNRIHRVVNKKYEQDTLRISKHILCIGLYKISFSFWEIGQSHKLDDKSDFQTFFDTDSLYNAFKNSMEKVNKTTPVQYANSDAINYCDDNFLEKKKLKFRHFDIDRILDIIGDTKGETVLFPAIFIENNYRNESSGRIGSGVSVDAGYYIKSLSLKIMILIVKDNEIIYLRTGLYVSDKYYTYDKRNKTMLLEQENWDNLVKLVMKDYIKRLETNHGKGGDDVIIKEEPTKDYWQKY